MSIPECSPDLLRTLFLFEKLTDDQLESLCQAGHITEIDRVRSTSKVSLPPASTSSSRARWCCPSCRAAKTSRSTGPPSAASTREAGRRISAIVYRRSTRVDASDDSFDVFFVLDADKFGNAMREWFPMAVHLLEGVFFGKKNTQQIIDQRERLLALGSLSAGLTHELNNPAAAAVRATASLRERVAGMRHKLGMVASGTYDRDALVTLMRLQEEVAEVVAKAPTLTPLEASDREDSLGEWFEDHSIREGWDLAPTFVQAGLDTAWLENVAAAVDESVLEGAIRWLNYTIESELLMNEIADSTTRISTLVGAAKQYSQMDRAPFQTIDVHELLDSTLIMLGQKIGSGIEVVKEYDLALPPIDAYAAELNQVWTNLIDNAVSAMDGSGTLTVRTSRDGDRVCIEICDTGAGIPDDVIDRIFEPFFTTKPVGEGTGLGLDISWRIVVGKHRGELRVTSEPGNTRFRVLLPIAGPPRDTRDD